MILSFFIIILKLIFVRVPIDAFISWKMVRHKLEIMRSKFVDGTFSVVDCKLI